MKKTAIVLIIGLVTMATGASFLALGRPPGPPPHGGAFFGGPPGPPPGLPPHGDVVGILLGAPPELMKKLELTDDQLKEIRLAYVGSQNKTRKARSALMGLRDEKRTMMISGKIDQAKLAKCDEEIVKFAAEIMDEELKMARESLSSLTPEQVERLANFLSKMEMVHGPKMMSK